jgi:diacylglycerol kinase family enzyme
VFEALKIWRDGNPPPDISLHRLRAAHLTAAPIVETHGAVFVETDGESVGLLPATFEILPGAINLRC